MIDFDRIFEDAVVELETGLPLDEALSGAESTKFRNLLKKNIVKFRYKKKDGSVRTALGTLKKDVLPKYKTEKRPAYNPTRFVYWDTERDQFRSFLRANFMDLEDPKKAGKEDAGKKGEDVELNESAEDINLFKPGTSVSVVGIFMAQLIKMGAKFKNTQKAQSYMQITGQYDSEMDLGEDMLQGEIPGYSSRYITQNDFLKDVSDLNRLVTDRMIYASSLRGMAFEYRPIRVSLYKSQKFGGKLMLGCYSLFKKTDEFEQNPHKDSYLEYDSSRVIVPIFGLCITLTNLLDVIGVFGVKEIDAGICNMAINNWNDHTPGWLAKQRVSEGVRINDISAEKLVNDWNFLDDSMAVQLCRIDCIAGYAPRRKNPAGVDKSLRYHFINHKAYGEIRKYLKQNADLGRPIMQAVKRPQGRYENQDDRLCILTDKAFQVEWYISDLNKVKSISFCDPVQIVEWYVGSTAEAAFASRVPDRSKIPVSFLKLAYRNQKAGLGFGLDHAV